jgi:hypothetical protein
MLIHIGFHKTGTTFLQENLFFREDRGFIAPWTIDSGEAIEYLLLSHPCKFDAPKIRQLFWDAVKRTEAAGLIPVISHEGLSGDPVNQDYYEFEAANRIYQVFPEAKILIVIREQKTMIKSFYNQYVKQGGVFNIQHFLGDENSRRIGFPTIFRLDHLRYDLLAERYLEYFGRDSILILPMEILAQDQQQFLEKLYSFMGNKSPLKINPMPANASLQAATVELRRWLNSFPGKLPPNWHEYQATPVLWRAKNRLCRYADKVLPTVIHERSANQLKHFIDKRVGNYYSESNCRLQKHVDFDLKELGYML